MAIIKRLNVSEFREEFEAHNKDNFSYEALGELFEYYDSLSGETGEDFELDVVAICCEWCEMDAEEILRQYSHLIHDEDEEEDEQFEQILDCLRDNTEVIKINGRACWLMREF